MICRVNIELLSWELEIYKKKYQKTYSYLKSLSFRISYETSSTLFFLQLHLSVSFFNYFFPFGKKWVINLLINLAPICFLLYIYLYFSLHLIINVYSWVKKEREFVFSLFDTIHLHFCSHLIVAHSVLWLKDRELSHTIWLIVPVLLFHSFSLWVH